MDSWREHQKGLVDVLRRAVHPPGVRGNPGCADDKREQHGGAREKIGDCELTPIVRKCGIGIHVPRLDRADEKQAAVDCARKRPELRSRYA